PWSACGAAEGLLRHWRSHFDLGRDVTLRDDDVLASRPDALLLSRSYRGSDRASGGTYEYETLDLIAFGADGRVARVEVFDRERPAEALARFDELSAGLAAVRPVQRRVRPSAGRGRAARSGAAVAARDSAALPTMVEGEVLDHTTGTTWDGGAVLRSWGYLLRAEEPVCRHEPLATLGDSLALFRQSTS